MPRTSAWYVRAALIYLALGWTLGALLLGVKGTGAVAGLWLLRPLHVELLLVGWMAQFAVGVATWILPRTAAAPAWPLVPALVLLNAGVWLAGLAAPLGVAPALLAGRACELAAFLLLARHLLPRVRAVRREGH